MLGVIAAEDTVSTIIDNSALYLELTAQSIVIAAVVAGITFRNGFNVVLAIPVMLGAFWVSWVVGGYAYGDPVLFDGDDNALNIIAVFYGSGKTALWMGLIFAVYWLLASKMKVPYPKTIAITISSLFAVSMVSTIITA